MGTFGTIGSSIHNFETQRQLLLELRNHPIELVREWASNKLENTLKTIRREGLNEEENFL